MEFDLVKFINEGVLKQDKYAKAIGSMGPGELAKLLDGDSTDKFFLSYRYEKVIEHMSHMIEELVEARVYVPRRSWKKYERSFMDSPELREEFIVELYDVLLFFRAVLAFAGVSGEEFAKLAMKKDGYNASRADHNTNSGEHEAPHPGQELQGDCDSAKMNV